MYYYNNNIIIQLQATLRILNYGDLEESKVITLKAFNGLTYFIINIEDIAVVSTSESII